MYCEMSCFLILDKGLLDERILMLAAQHLLQPCHFLLICFYLPLALRQLLH